MTSEDREDDALHVLQRLITTSITDDASTRLKRPSGLYRRGRCSHTAIALCAHGVCKPQIWHLDPDAELRHLCRHTSPRGNSPRRIWRLAYSNEQRPGVPFTPGVQIEQLHDLQLHCSFPCTFLPNDLHGGTCQNLLSKTGMNGSLPIKHV